MKDFARVAQLSAEEAFRLLRQKHTQDESNAWVRFEAELTKQVNAITERYNSQLQTLRNEKGGLEIRLQELEKNQAEMLKNAKESERLETEKGLRDEMVALDGRIKELEAQAKVAESEKAVEVERVRLELEGKLGAEQTQNKDLTRRVDDYFGEITKLRERNTELEAEMAKVARVGKREEMDFADEALDELNRNRLRRRLSAQHLIF
jgi:chromosome segregation ATPase